jgi:hypothetical protein
MKPAKLGTAIFAVALLVVVCRSASTAKSSVQQDSKKPASSQTAPLTSQEKEAQKHYRIALEAIKNNDFSVAADELKAAAELAPKNAVIWYNLAVVESKKGDSAPALEHLKRAENIGLPKALQNDADQLEAKVTYDVMKEARKDAFSAKLLELKEEMKEGKAFGTCVDPDNAPVKAIMSWDYRIALQDNHNPRKIVIGIDYHDNTFFMKPFNGSQMRGLNGTAALDFADLSSDLEIKQVPMCHYGLYRWSLVLRAKKQGAFHLVGTTKEHVPPATEDRETAWVDGDALELNFPSQDSAQAVAKTLSDLIRMSADIQ